MKARIPVLQWKVDRNDKLTTRVRRSKKLRAQYEDVGDGWQAVPKRMELICCDCSLAHDIAFRVRMQPAAQRRHKKRAA